MRFGGEAFRSSGRKWIGDGEGTGMEGVGEEGLISDQMRGREMVWRRE